MEIRCHTVSENILSALIRKLEEKISCTLVTKKFFSVEDAKAVLETNLASIVICYWTYLWFLFLINMSVL